MGDIHLDYGITSNEYTLSTSMLGKARVSWITVMLNPVVFNVASLDKRFSLNFCSLEICYNTLFPDMTFNKIVQIKFKY